MKKMLIAGLFIAVSAATFSPTSSFARDKSSYGGQGRAAVSQAEGARMSNGTMMRKKMMMRKRMMMKRRMMR